MLDLVKSSRAAARSFAGRARHATMLRYARQRDGRLNGIAGEPNGGSSQRAAILAVELRAKRKPNVVALAWS